MKKNIAVTAILATSALAYAEDTVSFYGLIDVGIRYDTHAKLPTGQNKPASLTQMVNGVMNTSRIGLKGSEGLGGDLKARFTLESGFKASTGAAQNSASFFDRQASAGLTGSAGAIDIGRNTTFAFDLERDGVTDALAGDMAGASVNLQPKSLTPSGSSQNLRANPLYTFIAGSSTGARRDNEIKYLGTYGVTTIGLAYAPSSTAGSDAGRSIQAMLRVKTTGIDSGMSYDQLQDSSQKIQRTLSSGIGYTYSNIKLNAGYTQITADAGFDAAFYSGSTYISTTGTTSDASTQSVPLYAYLNPSAFKSPNTPANAPGVKGQIWNMGVGYSPLPQLNVIGAYYKTKISSNVQGSQNAYDTVVVRARYGLSKRTDLYAALDHTKARDLAASSSPSGARTDTGITAGIQHRF